MNSRPLPQQKGRVGSGKVPGFIEEVPHSEAKIFDLPLTENYSAYRWSDGVSEVFFSATQQGQALTIHIAAGNNGKVGLRRAVNEFCEAMFERFDWCRAILGVVAVPSVINLAKKCGFSVVGFGGGVMHGEKVPLTIVMRTR